MDNELEFKGSDKVKAIQWFVMYAEGLETDKQYKLTIKECKRKRSLNANNYAWKLINELAIKLNKKPVEVYRNYIDDIGDNYEYMRVIGKDVVDTLTNFWSAQGLGWITKVDLTNFENHYDVYLYYGSSRFNTQQMSRLISLIVQDCLEFGVKTYNQEELDRLVQEWGVE